MIKFQKFYVTDGAVKAKVFYSAGQINRLQPDGSRKLEQCVTLYARDYERALGTLFPKAYENDTDYQSDYFDQGRVRIFPGDELYAAALARAEQNELDDKARAAAKQAKRDAAKRAAWMAGGYLDDFNYVGSRHHY